MQYILAYQGKSKMEFIRKQIVLYALQYGNEAAVEKYECHRNTVSKWKNRFKKNLPWLVIGSHSFILERFGPGPTKNRQAKGIAHQPS